MPQPVIQRLRGPEAEPFLREVASLRIEVFREYPYLYNGSIEYERDYLGHQLTHPESVWVLATSPDGKVVGCSTGMPLDGALPEFQKPFSQAGLDPACYFYFGESVLRQQWRGLGIGHKFFDEREAHARDLGRFHGTAFCAVERSPHHPLRPSDYRPLDRFWQKRGYYKTSLRTTLAWPDLDAEDETEKPLVFWLRDF